LREEEFMMRKIAAVLTGAVVALVPLVGGAGQASAADSVQKFTNGWSKYCLDDTSVALRTHQCNGTAAQKFNVHVWADGTRELRSIQTGRCVDDSVKGLRSVVCNKSKYQSWYVDHIGGSIRFRNQYTGNCMDDSPKGFRAYACNTTAYQKWT
jgi:hypothetical protein